MQTLETLQRKIKTAQDLHSVVRTMKTLAAVNIRQYEEAVASLADYARTVNMGLQVVLKSNPQISVTSQVAPRKRMGVILFGSDQGMCGQLNDLIVNYAQTMLQTLHAEQDELHVLVVGERAAVRLEQPDLPVQSGPLVPGSLDGIVPAVQDILLILDDWLTERHVQHILLFYTRHRAATFLHPHMDRLLPVDQHWLRQLEEEQWPTKVLPTFTMNADRLFSSLIRQYLFISLYRGFAESLASENASRLRSMQNAEKNIHERLEELQTAYHQERQMSITSELLDIVSGFEALSGDS